MFFPFLVFEEFYYSFLSFYYSYDYMKKLYKNLIIGVFR